VQELTDNYKINNLNNTSTTKNIIKGKSKLIQFHSESIIPKIISNISLLINNSNKNNNNNNNRIMKCKSLNNLILI